MIDKEKARQQGLQVTNIPDVLPNEKEEKKAQLKSLIPNLVNGDGSVNVQEIQDFFGQENVVRGNQGYSLNFVGKTLAKAVIDMPTKKELKIEHKQSKHFDKTKNLIIRGDNLDALKLLKQNYYQKIKMIYIDPPYNTKSDEFTYKDNFHKTTKELIQEFDLDDDVINFFDNVYGTRSHSGWLSFMYPRLKLARDLLADDGVIFISIDDNEMANLKIICDEIFGEENFFGIFSIKTPNQTEDKNRLRNLDFLMVYTKIKAEFKFNVKLKPQTARCTTGKEDQTQSEITFPSGIEVEGVKDGIYDSPDNTGNNEDIRITKGKFIIKDSKLAEPVTLIARWSNPRDIKAMIEKHNTKSASPVFNKFGKELTRLWIKGKRFQPQMDKLGGDLPDSFWINFTKKGSDIFNQILPEAKFNYPKHPDLIKYIIGLSTNKKDSLILDYFAGSGTTAQAVMELNAEDGGKRQFIMVQWDEEIQQEKSQQAYDFCKTNGYDPVISSIMIERIHRAGEKIKEQNGGLDNGLDIGYKVFSLVDRPILEMDDEQKLALSFYRATTKDSLYNLLMASGKDLHQPIETIEEDVLYKVANAYYVLGECTTSLKDKHEVYIDGYANINLENWLNMVGVNKESVKIIY